MKNIISTLDLFRFNNCLILFLGILLVSTFLNQGIMITNELVFLASSYFFVLGAINILNDIVDLKIDLRIRPKKPLPSKALGVQQAWVLLIVFSVIGLYLAIMTPVWYVVAISLILGFIYDLFSKKLGILKNLIVVFDSALAPVAVGLLFGSSLIRIAVVFFWIFFLFYSREIFKDIEDVKADKGRTGSSIPIKLGNEKAKIIASLFLILSLLSLIGGILVLRLADWPFLVVTLLAELATVSKVVLDKKIDANLYQKILKLIYFIGILLMPVQYI